MLFIKNLITICIINFYNKFGVSSTKKSYRPLIFLIFLTVGRFFCMAIFVLKKFLPLYTPKINFFKIAIDSIVPTDNTIALYSEYGFQVYLLEMV